MSLPINTICFIGVGLIGGSFALALREKNPHIQFVGTSRNEDHLKKAVELKVIDRYELDIQKAVQGVDLVVVCVPLGAMEMVFKAIAPALSSNVVITDVGSAKVSVVAMAKKYFAKKFKNFVPGHPIAGTEHSGVEAAFSTLYEQKRVILTPVAETDSAANKLVAACWQAVGAIVEEVDIKTHDEMLALTSHLPHLLAFSFINTLIETHAEETLFHYSAGGFRDFSRIASSDPTMWRDICLTNKKAIIQALEQYEANLASLKKAIIDDAEDEIFNRFEAAKKTRDAYI